MTSDDTSVDTGTTEPEAPVLLTPYLAATRAAECLTLAQEKATKVRMGEGNLAGQLVQVAEAWRQLGATMAAWGEDHRRP